MTRTLRHRLATTALAGCLAGCGPVQPAQEPPVNATAAPEPVENLQPPEPEGKSIIRPAIEEAEPAPPPIEPIEATIGFAKGGALDDAGRVALEALLAEPALQAGGPIRLSGHSDSKGSDADNLRTSRRRAEAVRDYLVEKGVAPDRITVIALGETRPIAPNAHPDGSDDEAGRTRNRRVEVEVALPEATPSPAPSSATTATPPA